MSKFVNYNDIIKYKNTIGSKHGKYLTLHNTVSYIITNSVPILKTYNIVFKIVCLSLYGTVQYKTCVTFIFFFIIFIQVRLIIIKYI